MALTTPLEISWKIEEEAAHLHLSGGLFLGNLGDLDKVMQTSVDKKVKSLYMDLSDLEMIDSSGIGAMVRWYRMFTSEDREFRIMHLTGSVLQAFQVTNLVNVFDLSPDGEGAADQIRRQRRSLLESHDYSEQIISALGEGVVAVDVRGSVLFVNPVAEKMLEEREDALLGRPFLKALRFSTHEDNICSTAPLLSVASGARKIYRGRFCLRQPDGALLPIDLIATAIFSKKECVGAIIGFHDISESLNLTQALKASDARYDLFVQAPGRMAYMVDLEGHIAHVTDTMAKELGYTVEELLGEPESRVLLPPRDGNPWESDPCKRSDSVVYTGSMKKKCGRLVPVDALFTQVLDCENKITGSQAIILDASERFATGQALMESEKRLRTICENSPDALLFYRSSDNTLVYANPACEKMTGYPVSDFYKRIPPQLVKQEDLADAWRVLRSVNRGEKVPFREYEMVTKSGGTKWVESSWMPLFDGDNEQFGYMCLTRDITERKTAEQQLEKARDRFLHLYDHAQAGLFRIEMGSNRILECNQHFARMIGYASAKDCQGRFRVQDLIADTPEMGLLIETLSSSSRVEGFEIRLNRIDGSPFWCSLTVTLFPDENYFEGVLVDITKEKLALEGLRESRERYRRLLEAVTSYTFRFQKGKPLEHSEGSTAVLGWRPEELSARPSLVWRIIHREDLRSVLNHVRRIEAGERVGPISFRIIHHNGAIRCLRVTTASTFGPNGEFEGCDGLTEDITEHRKLEEELRHAQKMEAIGQLAGGIAHDFNNILTGILGNLSLAEIDASPMSLPLLHEAQKAGQRASELVKKLLAFSRKSEVVMAQVDIQGLIHEVAEFTRNTFDRRIEIHASQCGKLPMVLGDPIQLHQVLLNLCVNARDSIEERLSRDKNSPCQIRLQSRLVNIEKDYVASQASAPAGEYIELSVTDTGTGIRKEDQKRIFDPFFSTKGGKGTGLGLASVYGIVQQHSGWINVYSEEGQGTTFKIYLPCHADAATQSPSMQHKADLPRGTETVLLVDDEEMIRSLGRSILTRLGYKVILAEDGMAGIQTFLKHQDEIDITVLDISMPVMSGLDVLEKILAAKPDACVILSSGYPEHLESASEKTIQDAAAFVAKPYRPGDLAIAVRKALDENPAKK